MANLQPFSLDPEPDLHPLYPSTLHIQKSLSQDSGLDSVQKAELVVHCLKRACLFADLSILQFLLSDRAAQTYVDLGIKDDDGVGLIILTIHGFGGDLDRDVEREECVRYLVSQGADLGADNAGWTPLHHAAIIAPPTLVSYLMTHGCSPFEVTHHKLTPLDIVTAHSVLPGREDIALLLEEAMRGEGWSGGPIEQRRRLHERREKRRGKRKAIRDDVSSVLGIHAKWWEPEDEDLESDVEEDDANNYLSVTDENIYTPNPDYASMLAFSPTSLPRIFESVITNYPVLLKDPTPAQTLYLLARFACLTCDHLWLEDLIIGATDCIEDSFFNNPDDLPTLIFWLHNTSLWMHLLQCDKALRPACEILGSFELIEEVINSVFVFIIRFAERKIDQLLDSTILDYAPSGSETETVQFESEWSFLRQFTKKKAPPPPPVSISQYGKKPLSSPTASIRTLGSTSFSPTTPKFSSIRQTLARAHSGATGTPSSALFSDPSSVPSTYELTAFLTALHIVLTFADVNPIFTTQLWSQVFYWTSCEIFNRIVTRKKYLCRTRALQIQINLSVIDDWVEEMCLPPGVLSHFAPVKDLLIWLQCLSSVSDFPELVSVIQSLKHLNPLQMRRAIRDYKYEVNENRMNDECIQYVIQLQKDWERHRVKLGVEILRKEISDRDRERDDASTHGGDASSISDQASVMSTTSLDPTQRNGIDLLLDRDQDRSWWQPIRAPQALGELLDSRHMIPLLFPDDPKLLAAHPSRAFLEDVTRGTTSPASTLSPPGSAKSSIDLGNPGGPLLWRCRDRQVRHVDPHVLHILDGPHSASQWWRNYDLPLELEEHEHIASPERVKAEQPDADADVSQLGGEDHQPTPLTVRKPSIRTKGRGPSMGDVTPVEGSFQSSNRASGP